MNEVKPVGIVLVNLGTPDAPTPGAIRRYLAEFLADRRVVNLPRILWLPILYGFILPFRPGKLVEKYETIWGDEKGPILTYTEALAGKVQKNLHGAQLAAPVSVRHAMTYGNPSLADAIKHFKGSGIDNVMIFPLFPQYSTATTAAVFDKLVSIFGKTPSLPSLRFISDYHDYSEYVHALTKSIEPQLDKVHDGAKLLFSFHGIPVAQAKSGDPYPERCRRTTELVAQNLGLEKEQWMLTFQSRFGPAPWLQPYTDDTLASLPPKGIDRVVIVCPGFAADCLETLEEIDVENRQVFLDAGGKDYTYVPALNDSDDHVQMVSELIIDHLYESESLRRQG